ncbi:hemolysin family protein [Tamaricihabitans halophyticus]|nr:hemolysin family protein [Tamaricihabitans halophyticus]
MTLLTILLGVLVIVLLSVLTGYFVAQEFGYMAVDRSRLKSLSSAGDTSARRALRVTSRTSFMLSGAQLGITVTGLLVGYVAEPLIGDGISVLLGGVGVPQGVGIAIGIAFALLLSTVVQMVFGELFPKNLAIARPEPVARRLAWSTNLYLGLFGWLIWLFDQAAILLLKVLRIEPVHDVEHAATPRDLEHIVAESKEHGDLPAEMSTMLDRVLDFHERTADHAMIPRTKVTTIPGDAPVSRAVELMASSYSLLPVLGTDVDDVIGTLSLRDVLRLDEEAQRTRSVRELVRPAVMVPTSLPLPTVVERLGEAGQQLACVVDEYGGLAGVITGEDIAEELVGEISDEHDPQGQDLARRDGNGGWLVSGTIHIDEAERLLDHELPTGDYETIGGLITATLQRLPEPGDVVRVDVPQTAADEEEPRKQVIAEVRSIDRHVPATVRLTVEDVPEVDPASEEVSG